MLILCKTIILNLILTAMLLTATAVCAETVEYEGLIEPYVVVNIGAPDEGVVAEVSVDRPVALALLRRVRGRAHCSHRRHHEQGHGGDLAGQEWGVHPVTIAGLAS